MLRIPSILTFVRANAKPFHAALLHDGLEVQVNAAPDGGTPVTGEHRGHSWRGWSDGKTTWKHIRIPWHADTEPEYQDSKLTWKLEEHADGIGFTGWNWKARQSEFFVFDLDSVANHAANALTDDQMKEVEAALSAVPFVSIAKSKSGKGRHAYVVLDEPLPSANHHEHTARAHAVLGLLSALTGRDLHGDADCVGVVAWFWHRGKSEDGFALVKEGEKFPAAKMPQDWKDHVGSVAGRKHRTVVAGAVSQTHEFEELVREMRRTPLDDGHRKLLAWFATQGHDTMWSWNPDLWLLVAHTVDLARAHEELGLAGVFYTTSTGKNRPDQNCFAVPMPDGMWQVRRFGKGIEEHPAWSHDRAGWTRCNFNVPATLELAATIHGGVKADGRWVFETLDTCLKALGELGFEIDPQTLGLYLARAAELKEVRGKIVASFATQRGDPKPQGAWATDRGGKHWLREFTYEKPRPVAEAPDDEVRAIAAGDKLWSFAAFTGDGQWLLMAKTDALTFLRLEHEGKWAEQMVSMSMHLPWRLVNKPFEPEYPCGGREWNYYGAKLAFDPKPAPHPTWDKMLDHLGQSLDNGVAENEWCRQNGVLRGRDYLLLWCARLFQKPRESLPYLFLHSSGQETGKSSLHEALRVLFRDGKGFVRAKDALTSPQFNGALSGAVLCVVEEVDVSKQRDAYSRIKDWALGQTIEIRALYQDPRTEPNYTHWIQCANEAKACPVGLGDTRITMMHVAPISDKASREDWRTNIEAEGPAFLHTLLSTEIPKSYGRTGIPALTTASKEDQIESNMNALERFMRERTVYCPGAAVTWAEFWKEFVASLDGSQRVYWTERRVRRELPGEYPRGKFGPKNDAHIGNMAWTESGAKPGGALQRVGEQLRSVGRSEVEPAVQPMASVGTTEGAADVAA